MFLQTQANTPCQSKYKTRGQASKMNEFIQNLQNIEHPVNYSPDNDENPYYIDNCPKNVKDENSNALSLINVKKINQ